MDLKAKMAADSLLSRLKRAKKGPMLRQNQYEGRYIFEWKIWEQDTSEDLEEAYHFMLREGPVYSAIAWRALKDELASRVPQRSEIHELTAYDL
jgi:hypothetical protein